MVTHTVSFSDLFSRRRHAPWVIVPISRLLFNKKGWKFSHPVIMKFERDLDTLLLLD